MKFLSVSETNDQNLWNTVKRKPGCSRKLQIATEGFNEADDGHCFNLLLVDYKSDNLVGMSSSEFRGRSELRLLIVGGNQSSSWVCSWCTCVVDLFMGYGFASHTGFGFATGRLSAGSVGRARAWNGTVKICFGTSEIVMAPFILNWNCLARLDNPAGHHAVEINVEQIGDHGKVVPKEGFETVPLRGIPKEQVPIQGIIKQPSFADVVNGTSSETNNKKDSKQFSFAAVLNGSLLSRDQSDSTSQTVITCKGNIIFVRVNDNAYQERIALCQFSLIAQIILSKGDKLWKFEELRLKLQSIWNVGHSMAKCKSMIGKAPPKVGPYSNEKENKPPSLTQVYKLKQASPLHVESTTPSMPTTNTLEITSWPDAFGDSDDEPGDDANDIVEDE
ncbi:hypothetical protein FNV43_RR04575 [Rhamnella rubrinervis]|uniref:Uncharacterized protein n=1 Tax=Rhamnella rubrinervis TaxID=2594499 RepID=A0A8K0HLA3_9ROSA|nr:hypothetical protein FNV43_RR04575 [Rhamnella rubrinervis]